MKYSAAANPARNPDRPEGEGAADCLTFSGDEGHVMLHPPTFRCFEDAQCAVLKHVGQNFGYVIAPREKCARECPNVSFIVDYSRDRLSTRPPGGPILCSASRKRCGTCGDATTWT
jgi:hypothetical protein